jgi:hypothetical protein
MVCSFKLTQRQKWGGYFNDELDAAKRLNQLCEELEISLQNPGITGMPNQQVTQNFLFHPFTK